MDTVNNISRRFLDTIKRERTLTKQNAKNNIITPKQSSKDSENHFKDKLRLSTLDAYTSSKRWTEKLSQDKNKGTLELKRYNKDIIAVKIECTKFVKAIRYDRKTDKG